MRTIKCIICGQPFETSKPNKKYCSFSCRIAAENLRRMKRKEADPEYNKNYMRQYRQRQKEGAEDGPCY